VNPFKGETPPPPPPPGRRRPWVTAATWAPS